VQLDPSAFLADPELLQALEKHSIPLSCDTDRVLFNQSDPSTGLYILHKGEAVVSMTGEDGAALMSIKATAGSLLGLPGVIGNQPYSLTAIALSGAQVSFIAREDFNALMQSQLNLLVKVLQVLAAEVRSARLAITHL
jgi:CRP-like cAMP-binding protein